jgi:signal transduction histidine kinase
LVVEFTSELAGERFPALVEIVCFRVAQEALTNVFRHARATHCWIELTRTTARIQIVIRDNGRGFDPVAARKRALGGESFGLLGMLERVQLYSGEMTIDSAPDQGTTIRASFPLAKSAERAELERAS